MIDRYFLYPAQVIIPEIETNQGKTIYRFGPGVETRVDTKCWMAEGASSTASWREREVGDRTVITLRKVAQFPSDMAGTIRAFCRVFIDGSVYDLDGEPSAAHTPRGIHHVDVVLRDFRG